LSVSIQADCSRSPHGPNWITGCIATSTLVVVVAILLWYLADFYRPLFNSDDAVLSMLGEAIWQQGRLLPVGWINNNGDLMMPSGALITALLFHWLPNGYSAHAVASTFAVFFMLGSLGWLLCALQIPRAVILFLLTFVAAGVSYDFSSMVFAQTTYVWWSAGFFVGAGMLCQERSRLPSLSQNRWIRPVSLFVLVFGVSFANPARVGLMMVLPLYALDRALALGGRKGGAPPGFFASAGVGDPIVSFGLGASFLAAAALYALLAHMGITQASYNAAALYWGGWASVWKHLSTFEGWLNYLGAGVNPFERNPSGFLWLRWFRWSLAFCLTAYAMFALLRTPIEKDRQRRAFTIALICAFLPIFFIYVVFEPLAVTAGSLRYFIVPMSILFVLAAFGLRDFANSRLRAAPIVLAMLGFLLIPVSIQRFIPLVQASERSLPQIESNADSRALRLAQTLRHEGLRWGYATWWNAGATTVLSGGAVRVNPVDLGPSGVTAFSYMVLKDWYRPSSWKQDTFLALDRKEAGDDRISSLRLVFGDPKRVIDTPDYRVAVYSHNIAEDFGCENNVALNEPLTRGNELPRLLAANLDVIEGTMQPRLLKVRIRNDAKHTVSGVGRYPMSVGVQLLRADGSMVAPDWNHTPIQCPIAPGRELSMNVLLPETPLGDWLVRVDLVQEQVAWFANWGGAPLQLPLVVGAAEVEGPESQ